MGYGKPKPYAGKTKGGAPGRKTNKTPRRRKSVR